MVHAMEAYWLDHPPVHVMVAAYLGVKPGASVAETESLHDLPHEIAADTVTAPEFDALLKSRGFAQLIVG